MTLAALDLRELTGELARADELRDGLTLRVKPEAVAALPVGGNAIIRNETRHVVIREKAAETAAALHVSAETVMRDCKILC